MRCENLNLQNQTIIPQCWIAKGFFSRFVGLMGRKSLSNEEAICFPRCNSIHTFFMRFPIDVVMVDEHGRIINIVNAMRPWRFLPPKFRAKHIIEMKANRCEELGLKVGSRLTCNGVWT